MRTSIASYTTANILLSPFHEEKEKPAGEIYTLGVPVYALGQLLYENIDVNIFEGQRYVFAVLWQSFFDSLLFSEIKPVVIDSLIVLGSTMFADRIIENK